LSSARPAQPADVETRLSVSGRGRAPTPRDRSGPGSPAPRAAQGRLRPGLSPPDRSTQRDAGPRTAPLSLVDAD